MNLTAGTRLGPYDILSPLGAGGMGEVWLARDERLDRQVAIKVLPEAMAHDPERVLRFEREAKLLASLSHAHIAAIHGFEESQGTKFLVLEYVEGRTLAARLDEGPLPIDEALETCKHIAEALEAAHEKGVVHRDLKPGNVMVKPDGTVKVLDFGLARAMQGDISSGAVRFDSPTITGDYTKPGVVLGTAPYMSPEQARGRQLDRRSDIWSFGVILYECLTGEMLFRGESATDSLGAILHREPQWEKLPPGTPPTVQLLLRRCVTKDRNQRLHDIADARIELEAAIADPSASSLGLAQSALTAVPAKPRQLIARVLLVGVLIAAAAAGASLSRLLQPRAARPVMRLTMTIPDSQALRSVAGSMMDISPDGTRVVFVGHSESGQQLYLRQLNQLDAVPLANTDGAFCPFFSPDGEWIAFGQKSKLRSISVLGGPTTVICNAKDLRGGSWGVDGIIAFAPDTRSGIWTVSAAGGEPVKLTDAGSGEAAPSHRWPHLLPDGKNVLFTATDRNSDYTEAKIIAVSLATRAQKVIINGGTFARYLPSGYLVYERAGTLMAVRFDPRTLETTGATIPILEGVLNAPLYGGIQYACSQTGVLVFVPGSAGGDEKLLIWIDREGKESPVSRHKRDYMDARMSPDGSRIAASIMNGGNADIWILETERDSFTRLTVDESADANPRWSPDGTWIAFSSNRGKSDFSLFRQLAGGTGEAERLTTSDSPQAPYTFSPDGSNLVFRDRSLKTGFDIMYLRLDGPERTPKALLATQFDEGGAGLSPDGKWVAHVSNESGEAEIYVRPFLRPGAKVKVSEGRGFGPKWSPDGKEIIYRNEGKIMAVPISIEKDVLRPSPPRLLFEVKANSYTGPLDVSVDGKRALFIRPAVEFTGQSQQPIVVTNWFEEINAKSALQR